MSIYKITSIISNDKLISTLIKRYHNKREWKESEEKGIMTNNEREGDNKINREEI